MRTENENVSPAGISFGGGADNEYIKEFAQKREEAEKSGGTEEQIREEIRSIRPMADVFPAAEPEKRAIPMNAASQPRNHSWVMPPEEDAFDEPDRAPERVHLPPEEETDVKPELHGFKKVFSENAFLSAATLLGGIFSAVWAVLYIVVLNIRASMFTSAQATMLSRGQTSYSLTFDSPLLGVLKVLIYFIPVLAVLFAAALKTADNKGHRYGRKMIIAVLCVIVFAGVLAGFDIGFAHLIF